MWACEAVAPEERGARPPLLRASHVALNRRSLPTGSFEFRRKPCSHAHLSLHSRASHLMGSAPRFLPPPSTEGRRWPVPRRLPRSGTEQRGNERRQRASRACCGRRQPQLRLGGAHDEGQAAGLLAPVQTAWSAGAEGLPSEGAEGGVLGRRLALRCSERALRPGARRLSPALPRPGDKVSDGSPDRSPTPRRAELDRW